MDNYWYYAVIPNILGMIMSVVAVKRGWDDNTRFCWNMSIIAWPVVYFICWVFFIFWFGGKVGDWIIDMADKIDDLAYRIAHFKWSKK